MRSIANDLLSGSTREVPPGARRGYAVRSRVDLSLTLAPLQLGAADPTTRLRPRDAWQATWTPAGPGTLHLWVSGDILHCESWGPGGRWLLDHAAASAGLLDDRHDFAPTGPVAELTARLPGLRIGRSGDLPGALLRATLADGVTPLEAACTWASLVRRLGHRAPATPGLWLGPPFPVLASLSDDHYAALGLAPERAERVRAAAALAERLGDRFARLDGVDPREVARRLEHEGFPARVAARAVGAALGDADAVPLGDPALCAQVTEVLLGERSSDDAVMLRVLEPYAGQRGRVVRLVEALVDRTRGRGRPRVGAAQGT